MLLLIMPCMSTSEVNLLPTKDWTTEVKDMGDDTRVHLQDQRAGHRRLQAPGLANQRDQLIWREFQVLVWTRIPRPLYGAHPGAQGPGPGRHIRPGMVRQGRCISASTPDST